MYTQGKDKNLEPPHPHPLRTNQLLTCPIRDEILSGPETLQVGLVFPQLLPLTVGKKQSDKQEMHRAKIFRETDKFSKDRNRIHQCVDNVQGQLNTKEHERPSCSLQSPCLHATLVSGDSIPAG